MTEQEKRETVIKGLEGCFDALVQDEHALAENGVVMSFWQDRAKRIDAIREAIAFLKAQEPRAMTLEEVRALQDGAVVWIEDNDKVDIIPAIVNHIWNSLPNMASFTAAHVREVKADMLWYGVKWRCWTSRPTDAQREKEPWNG